MRAPIPARLLLLAMDRRGVGVRPPADRLAGRPLGWSGQAERCASRMDSSARPCRSEATSPTKGDARDRAWCDGAFDFPLWPAGVAGRGT
jgi:hypothetical protein